MSSKKAGLKLIRDWINQSVNEAELAAKESACAEATGCRSGFSYRYIDQQSSTEALVDQFFHLLDCHYDPSFHQDDWTVEIQLRDRDRVLYIRSLDGSLGFEVNTAAASQRTDLQARFSVPFEDLRQLTNFETDYVTIIKRNGRLDDPAKPLVRPLSDVLFAAYNAHYLNPAFNQTLLQSIYRTGRVDGLSGESRFIYPWAISADIGNVLYEMVEKHQLRRSLEIGLAYGLSALFICQAHKNATGGHHTAIDPCQSVEFQSIGVDQIRKAGLADRFRLLEYKDYDILPRLLQNEERFEFIFIDGLHMHDYVVVDYFYSDLLLEEGGFIAFDDCHAPGVSSAVAYLEKNRKYAFVEEHSDYRVRVYQKVSEDVRTINNPNYHVEYFDKYRELAGLEKPAPIQPTESPAIQQKIAIVGIDALLPNGKSVASFWDAIADEEVMYGEYTPDYLKDRISSNQEKSVIAGLLPNPFDFDPDFFNISHNEAEMMDPQLRCLLMSVHKSIEDAGYTTQSLADKRVGVFIGSEGSEYNEIHRSAAFDSGYILNHSGTTLANRVSYYFDFKGPSEVVNTMCSSGAFGLSRAVDLLQKGEIDIAVVGAVKVNFYPDTFSSLADLNITTADKRCYSFHQESKGYIRSEGVISVVLTRSPTAYSEGDFVYAQIKAASVNFNGRDGNSMFSPSKNGQKEVIRSCYRKAGVEISDIAFIEAQGMGNEISDFVEFSAISEACSELAGEHASVAGNMPAISTIKPILGHMECVSALGALLKVIYSFRSGTVYRVPYLSEQQINSKLEQGDNTCRLLTRNQTICSEKPALAGLNSFGASGTNVHLLIEATEDHSPASDRSSTDAQEYLLTVSAKSERSLRNYLLSIVEYLSNDLTDHDLLNLCHAFHRHRESYQHRALFHVEAKRGNAVGKMVLKLQQYLGDKPQPGSGLDNLPGSSFNHEEDGIAVADDLSGQSDLLADGLRWLAGQSVDWTPHYQGLQPNKVGGLPNYPFDLKPYRLSTDQSVATSKSSPATQDVVHPLVHKNTSTLYRQSYSTRFSGDEFFLSDHRVGSEKVLPGVAYLEMARAAAAQAFEKETEVFELDEVFWIHPVVVSGSRDVSIVLHPATDAVSQSPSVDFEVVSSGNADDNTDEEIVHCQGICRLSSERQPVKLDLADLQQRLDDSGLDTRRFYRAFEMMGIQYGESHRGIRRIYSQDHEVFASVRLPEKLVSTASQYKLHPSILDSALQLCLCLVSDLDELPDTPYLPFSMDSLTVFSDLSNITYAWVRPVAELADERGQVTVDLDLCNPCGQVCLQVRGFSARALQNRQSPMQSDESFASDVVPEDKESEHVTQIERAQESREESTHSDDLSRKDSIHYFQCLLAEVLKTQPAKLGPKTPFSEFGLDSILVVQLTRRLREVFNDVTGTLFFEVQNLDGLVDHFIASQPETLKKLTSTTVVESRVPVSETSATTPPSFRLRKQMGQSINAEKRNPDSVSDIAIVGISGRYPGANNLSEFWTNLKNGINCITEIPAQRWSWQDYYDEERGKPGKMYTRWGGFIEDHDKFDPLFFQISPMEAELMNPQERIFIETCYHAIEDAGYTPENLDADRRIGVFAGVMNAMYATTPDHFSFANRVSYLFDFQGPSIALDTACSSSLTAIHLAIESLHSGSSTCAIAGGVNLIIDPAHYLRMTDLAALSAGNQCRSFGKGADGFIDAEGVGVAVLKPLQLAQQQGDHIYGVIKSSAVNAGGKTNGYTVPNPKAQADLIASALTQSGFNAEQVSYLEAHGTGTSLGDPIEIAGLSRAYAQFTDSRQFCAIGSLKSNIGHCEAAAGIAGLTKVLLQMKHQQLVPTLHADEVNPEIDFSRTPFQLQRTLKKWERLEIPTSDGTMPASLIAGISSFGIGGSNAHLIVEEYRCATASDTGRQVGQSPVDVAVLLSARTSDQLLQKAADLKSFIANSCIPDSRGEPDDDEQATTVPELIQIAYTLQVGREPMDQRLALVVNSLDQLYEKLSAVLAGSNSVQGVYRGSTGDKPEALALFTTDADLKSTVDRWLAEPKFHRLLELWVQGLEVDWNELYQGQSPGRVSLPVYPFARTRYWKDESDKNTGTSIALRQQLHPLVHCNTSDLSQQRYLTELSGAEFFLSDHQVDGNQVLPAAAYLEMARAAVSMAVPETEDAIELRNLIWSQPLIVNEPVSIEIVLSAISKDQVDFEIRSHADGTDTPHCAGCAVFSAAVRATHSDLSRIRAGSALETVDATEIYRTFAEMGIALGPAHQSIQAIYRGEHQLVAQLKLPDTVQAGSEQYLLHPSVLDGALQASIGLTSADGDLTGGPRLPFALDSLQIQSPSTSEMYAWVRYSDGPDAGSELAKVDIDLYDSDDNLCVQLRGLSSRPVPTPKQADFRNELLVARPVWESKADDLAPEHPPESVDKYHVLFCDPPAEMTEQLREALLDADSRLLQSQQESLGERYSEYALRCFEAVKTLISEQSDQRVLVQLVVWGGEDRLPLAGLSGLLKTASLENPRLSGQVILTDATQADQIADQVKESRLRLQDSLVRYDGSVREILRWKPLAQNDRQSDDVFEQQGVYLITGGLGGLGRLFTKEIIGRTEGANVIVTGRSELTAEDRAELEQIGGAHNRLSYRKVDLQDRQQVRVLIERIVSEYGRLNGIIHSAGMISDNFILKKPAEEFSRVLAPKVCGTQNLDLASCNIELDFFVLFSSGASVIGNPGQSDYATANGFIDGFAEYRNTMVAKGWRHGRTISINWPIWRDGGMKVDDDSQRMLTQITGMRPMLSQMGMDAFYLCLRSGISQVLVAAGDLTQMSRVFLSDQPLSNDRVGAVAEPVQNDSQDHRDDADLQRDTEVYLSRRFCELFKLPQHEVDARKPLEKYGMDSVLAMKLTGKLEQTFGSLSKTLFFEYQTISALAGYFVRAHRPQLEQILGGRPNRSSNRPLPARSANGGNTAQQRLIAENPQQRFLKSDVRPTSDIAIIGLSGKYPLAATLDEFWENLKQGRDCITEIPGERWDYQRYFDAERSRPGKSYSKWGGFVSDVDQFDPLFFNIAPKEAELMDPQERLFLETAWQALEDSAYTPDRLADETVGVYVGVMWGQYELYGVQAMLDNDTLVPSSSYASIANRVSYFFDLHGPSMAVDTMCSSSLTAIHLAVEAMIAGSINMAIAGGVNVSTHPQKYLTMSQGNFASSDGRCRSFGEGGDGYVPGEGVGVVILKPLRNAIEDRDQVYAVIKSSSLNHGGKTNGYTVPNPNAQTELIAEAVQKAGIDPRNLSYLEAHGTGTSLGDPIEITGLNNAFETFSLAKQSCPIGSVKSNIGHLESAAGIAAMTKVLLQMRHQQLVPSLHADTLNPNINFSESPFFVQSKLEHWQSREGQPRIAGISSFGAGGANAHVVLEEHTGNQAEPLSDELPAAQVFLLSAKDENALIRYADQYESFLKRHSRLSLADVAYTSQIGRTAFNFRLAIVCSDLQELRDQLRAWVERSQPNGNQLAVSDHPGTTAVFEGNTRDLDATHATLLEGTAGQTFLQTILDQGDLARIASLWVSGIELDWAQLHHHAQPRKVSLPTYPFDRERFWFNVPGAQSTEVRTENRPEAQSGTRPKSRKLYYPDWREQRLPSDSNEQDNGPLLVLGGTESELGLIRQQSDGKPVLWVRLGEEFGELGEFEYIVDPACEQHFVKLLDTIEDRLGTPRQIVHLCPLLLKDGDDLDSQARQERELYAVFHCCKVLMKSKAPGVVRLVSVYSSHLQHVVSGYSALNGFYKTLMLENPGFLAKVVTFRSPSAASAGIEADNIRRVLNELADVSWSSDEVLYRSGTERRPDRYVRTLSSYHPNGSALSELPIKQGGVYLISGGLGGLGYLFGEYLASRFSARLVLLGRSELDAAREAKLEALQHHSQNIIYRQVDIADAVAVQQVVDEVLNLYSAVNGVIHSAGVTRDAYILHKNIGDVDEVVRPKVQGAINLDRATEAQPLDFFVVFSSVSGTLGNPGQADYAYANRWLRDFAHARESLRGNGHRYGQTLSICWPLWDSGGMSIDATQAALAEQQTGLSVLPVSEGLGIFETLLRSGLSEGIALYGDSPAIDAFLKARLENSSAASQVEASNVSDAAGPEDALVEIEEYLAKLVSKEVGLSQDRIDVDESFQTYGLDSVMIGRLNTELEKILGALPKTLFYEYETIAELAIYLAGEKRLRVPRLSGVKTDQTPTAGSVQQDDQPIVRASDESLNDRETCDPVAIIGVHGRYPQSENLDQYWENISNGNDLVGLVPSGRWDYEVFFDADPAKAADGRIYCKWGAFLDDVDQFDASFFNISTSEAVLIDPQERLFLQSVWAAIEDAGYTRESLKQQSPKGRSADVGVFVGVTTNSYQLLVPEMLDDDDARVPSSLPWSIANRVSYFFDFQGPSLPVDTACSSSLTAVHMACESLRRRECQVALAGGVNLYLHPAKYRSFCQGRMVSRTGKTCSFGSGDDGFVPGEGVGTLVLKPLKRALADDDRIYAVICSSAVDHSGRSNNYSAPNPNAQAALIRRTLEQAGLTPASISYVEGHGTGTQLGDSLEIAALNSAFQAYSGQPSHCAVGSVKANIGHSESAAGVAGLTKILMQFKHRQLAPSIHSESMNPNLELQDSPFHIQQRLSPWATNGSEPRRALINSFGAGGVNACVVLEEHQEVRTESAQAARNLIILSARDQDRLIEYTNSLAEYLQANRDVNLDNLAYTLQVGREAMSERLAVIADNADNLIRQLNDWRKNATAPDVFCGTASPSRRRKRAAHEQDKQRQAEALHSHDLSALAQMWIEGAQVDWHQLHGPVKPKRIAAPTYPFAKQRYWIGDRSSGLTSQRSALANAPIHPLVSQNCSTLKQTSFRCFLSENSYYFRDHQISGSKVFPGAAMIEIACAAGSIAGAGKVRKIKDVVWLHPLTARGGDTEVQIFLKQIGSSTDYVLVSSDDTDERTVHSEGRLLSGSSLNGAGHDDSSMVISELRSRCSTRWSGERCYSLFDRFGLKYGSSFQPIQEYYTDGNSALSKLVLPDQLAGDFDQYILHPVLLDGAFQTILGLMMDGDRLPACLPFALDEIEILRPLARTCFVYAERSEVSVQPSNGIRQFDIKLLTQQGHVLAIMKKFYVRAVDVMGGVDQNPTQGPELIKR